MFRIKAPLVAAVSVLIVTALVFFQITGAMDRSITQRTEESVIHAQQQLLRSSRLEALDVTTLAVGFAREDEFAQIFAKANEDERRAAALIACDGHNGRLQKENRKAGIIGVVDAKGHLIARDLSTNWRSGEDLTGDYPSLAQALTGQPNKDVWDIEGVMYRVGAAAIRSPQGTVMGAVFIGYVQSAKDATEEAERAGVDVAYFFEARSKGKSLGMKIHASSFKRTEGASSESAEEKALAEQLFGANGAADPAISKHEATNVFHVRIKGEEWAGAAAPLLGNIARSSTKSGFVVLKSLTAAKAPTMQLALLILLLGGFAAVASIGAAVWNARRFLVPLDKLESGVTEIINGNRDYVFESPSQDLEGLANGLNVMLARLLGRPEPGEEEEGQSHTGPTTRWQGDSLFVDEAAAAGGASVASSEETVQLANEPADGYYKRIWREYVAARQKTGEGTDGLAEEPFLAKVKQNEATLAKKYGARMVRFKVVVKGNQTTLKPVPIN